MEKDAYIALGSNMGDRELNLLRAIAETGKIPSGKITALSSFYETSPVGLKGQTNFYNAVMRLTTALSPHELLKHLQHIENDIFHRKRDTRWGPRSIDLDLLLYNETIIKDDVLTIPHPRMTERRFVLQPLCDIAPDLIHPVSGMRIKEILESLRSDETVTKI